MRAPRRVALVTDWCLPRKGGIETNVMALAKSLIARGIDARILTSFPGPCEIDGVAIDRDAGLRLPLFELAASPRLVSRLAACLGAGGYDMVHVHASIVAPFCFAAVPAAYRVGLPVLVTFHSVMRNLPAMLAMSDRMMGWSGWNVTLTGVSSLVAGQIREAFPRRGVGILPNGLDVGFWRSGEGSAPQPGPLRLATAMRLRARKRPFALVDIFADALARARAAGTDMTLTIAGDGPKRAALWRHIERKGLAGTIRIAGWQDPPALRALYAESDAFVMPSTKEAFCIAALEARSAGLPVIARAGTGIADFIEDGVSGLLAHSDSAMAETLAAVARDRIRLRKLAIMPRNLARYGWDTLADEHIRTYADCMARAELVI